jgi:hypothetical protein
MAAVVALLLVLAALGAALMPLLGEERAADSPDEAARRELTAERDEVLAAIRDADLDLAMGKITTEDHSDLRRSLENRAVAILARLESGARG